MRWSLLLLLSAWTCLAQLPVVPLQTFTSAVASIPNPTNISATMYRWWVSKDVTSGFTISNQWVDRIVSDHMWQMNTTVSPTNSDSGAYFKRASSQFCTNGAGTAGYDIGQIAGGSPGDTFYAVFNPNGTAGDNTLFCGLSSPQGIGINSGNLTYTGNISGGPNTICALPTAKTNDVIVTFTATKTTWYTNGIPCRTNSTGSVDDFPYTRMGGRSSLGFYDGYIAENGIYTNKVFSISDAAALHKYLTNFWGNYGP